MATKYKKLDSISHIHQRPDMYIGTNKTRDIPSVFLYSDDNKIVFKEQCQVNDGILRIFLEALKSKIKNSNDQNDGFCGSRNWMDIGLE